MIFSKFGANIEVIINEFNIRLKEFGILKNSVSVLDNSLGIVTDKFNQNCVIYKLIPSCRLGEKRGQISLSCYLVNDSQICKLLDRKSRLCLEVYAAVKPCSPQLT